MSACGTFCEVFWIKGLSFGGKETLRSARFWSVTGRLGGVSSGQEPMNSETDCGNDHNRGAVGQGREREITRPEPRSGPAPTYQNGLDVSGMGQTSGAGAGLLAP